MTMRIGAKLPNSGPLPMEIGIPRMARVLEDAGFDSLWVSDHVVMPAEIRSAYPFAPDGRATWSTSTPWVDALVALALAAAVTERAELGTAVLVLPLRNPVEFAKQTASIDVASGGHLTLGVGAGWLREEFEALGASYERRGPRLVEWIEIVRSCWTGRTVERVSDDYRLPADVICQPTPAHDIPVLIGGHARPALRRAGTVADGWLGHQSATALDVEELARAISAVREARGDAEPGRIVVRIVDSAGRSEVVARRLPALARAGVDDVIVDVDWAGGDIAAVHERLRTAAAGE